jgi:beta-glucanase (GH16 family)
VTQNYTAKGEGKPVNFTTGFHTYAVEWDKNATTDANEIRFYVDGNLHFKVDENSSMSDANFTTPKNIILNLAVGGDFGGDPNDTTVFPQTMLVDYVRVWRRPTRLSSVYNGDKHIGSPGYLFATAGVFSIPEPMAGMPLGVSMMLRYAQPPWHD